MQEEVPLSKRKEDDFDVQHQQRIDDLLQKRTLKESQRKYEDASHLHQRILDEIEHCRRSKVHRELQRQERELLRLAHAKIEALQRSVECTRHAQSKARKYWALKVRQMEHRQEQEREDLERELDHKLSRQRVIFSSHVRDMQHTEQKLCRYQRYDESRMCRKKIQQLEDDEMRCSATRAQARSDRARNRLAAKHASERDFLMTQIKNSAVNSKRKATHTVSTVNQRFLNAEHDMAHSHSTELLAKPGSAFYEQPHFIKLNSKTGGLGNQATSRGTQLILQQEGGRTKIPSLVDLYGPELDLENGPTSVEKLTLPLPQRPLN
ncbi:hypothetical protein DIPPA_01333 [Diplonema papillatum]|nr:hypothetical protein DIPPA_01333 [Diplonema papillatum]